MKDEQPVLAPVRAQLRAAAAAIVPACAGLDDAQWLEVEAAIERALADRPESMRRQLRAFIRLLDLLPLVRFGKRLQSLGMPRRTAFLQHVERSKVTAVRRGFWGLRTLVMLGWYARPGAVDWRASPLGWEARR